MTHVYRAIVLLVYLFILAPILFVVVSSFGGSDIMVFPPSQLTLRWYSSISPELIHALVNSLVIASCAVVLAMLFGVGVSMAIARGRGRYPEVLGLVSMAPFAIPHLVIGIACFYASLIAWDATGVQLVGSRIGVILAHLVIAMPYVVRAVTVGHDHFDRAVEEAALNLGARRWYTFRRVTLPVLLPGLLSGALLAFLASFDDVPITLFMGGEADSTTLSLKILQAVQYSFDPDIMAISSLVILVTIALVVLVDRVIGLERLFGAERSK
jgi:putative spermidine/putrescine transport system permease protein